MRLVALVALSSSVGCYPTLKFEVAGPGMSLNTVMACPSPQPSPATGIAPSAKIGPQS